MLNLASGNTGDYPVYSLEVRPSGHVVLRRNGTECGLNHLRHRVTRQTSVEVFVPAQEGIALVNMLDQTINAYGDITSED